jgi:CubicO group peptidase (beta-lactamase class C family)
MKPPSLAGPAKPLLLSAILGAAVLTAPVQAQPVQDAEAADFKTRLRPRFLPAEAAIRHTLDARMAHYGVPGVAVAIIEDGEIVHVAGYGVQQAGGTAPVDADTVFSAGSVSKIATASLILRLAAEGRLDLDADIAGMLTSWTLPDSEFAGSPATLRMILSHTAGFNIHGFADFAPGAELPTVVDTLEGTAPATNEALQIRTEPGTRYAYSGGGYTLAQLLVSDVTGTGFTEAARQTLFDPLGLERSTFANPLPGDHGNIARAHDGEGRPAALPRGYESMPEMAASGLWTSARDLGTLTAALIESYRSDEGFLPRDLAAQMMTPLSPSEHGLGPRLAGSGADYIFHHGGSNESYQAWIEGHLASGDGLVVLTNGARGRGLYTEIRNAVADTMGWSVNRPVLVPDVTVPQAALAAYPGVYTVDPGFPLAHRRQMTGWIFDLDFEVRGSEAGGLEIGIAGGDRFDAMIPLSPTRFLMPGFAQPVGTAEVEFHRNAHGQTTGMTFHLANAQSHYVRQ